MPRRGALVYIAALLPIVPLVVSFGQELLDPLAWGPPGGDFAVLEIHLRDVASFKHFLGPYSRYGWNHPGPLYYYALLPLYWLSGGASASLYASAALLSVAAAVGTVVLFFRERRSTWDRLLFALALGAVVLDFAAHRLPSDPWNPIVTILPVAVLWLACARIAAGNMASLPLALILHAFLVQTHVSHAPCSSALLLAAAALGIRRGLLADRSRAWRGLLLSAFTVVLIWLPPIIAELGPGKSNLRKLIAHFTGGTSKPNSVEFALTYGSTQLQGVFVRLLRLTDVAEATLASSLMWLQGSSLLVGLVKARVRRDHFVVSACILSIVGMLACFWSCRHLGPVSGQHDYLTLWFAVVGMLGWLMVALAWLPVAPDLQRARVRELALGGLAVALLATCSVLDTRSILSRYRSLAERATGPRKRLEAGARRVASILRHSPRDYVVGTGQGRPWPMLAGALLAWRKEGIAPIVLERWRFMFGNGFEYAPLTSSTTTLTFARRFLHDARLLDAFGPKSFVYIQPPSLPVLAHVSVVASGCTGDPTWAVDGAAPVAGAPWDSPNVLRFDTLASSLSLELPGLRLDAIEAVLDGDDVYLVEASEDGRSFLRIAELPPAGRPGLSAHRVAFPHAGPWRTLRLKPLAGDGNYSVAEVRLDTSGWGVALASALEIVHDGRLAVDGKTPPAGARWSHANAVIMSDESSSMTFSLPSTDGQDARVDGLRVMADANDEYSVSGSYDGSLYERIGTLPQQKGRGQRSRDFFFNDGRSWAFVRLSPTAGDGRYSISEVTPLMSPGRRIDFAQGAVGLGSSGLVRASPGDGGAVSSTRRSHMRVTLPPGVDERLGVIAELAEGAPSGSVHVCLNGTWVATIDLSRQRETHGIGLPGALIEAETEIELVSAPTGVGRDAPAFRLDSLWLTPLEGRSPALGGAALAQRRSFCEDPADG
jgi:hypothetical protein